MRTDARASLVFVLQRRLQGRRDVDELFDVHGVEAHHMAHDFEGEGGVVVGLAPRATARPTPEHAVHKRPQSRIGLTCRGSSCAARRRLVYEKAAIRAEASSPRRACPRWSAVIAVSAARGASGSQHSTSSPTLSSRSLRRRPACASRSPSERKSAAAVLVFEERRWIPHLARCGQTRYRITVWMDARRERDG